MDTYREFTQEWINHKSPFNHFLENNVLFDFFGFCDEMKNDLSNLSIYYKNDFDKHSKIKLDKYKSDFNNLYSNFVKICCKDDTSTTPCNAYYMIDKVKDDILITNGEYQKISDKYFNALKQIAHSLFDIETKMAETVEYLWLTNLSSSMDHDESNYAYLVHADLGGWRRDCNTEELKKYSNNLKSISTSFVNNTKTRFFKERDYQYNGISGYVVKIKKGAFIAAGNNDIFSTEYIDGKCEFYEQYNYSKVKRLFIENDHEIYGNGTRICTPLSCIKSPADTPSEVLLNRDFVEIERAFYTLPHNDYRKQEIIEESKRFSPNSTIEPLQLCSLNKLNQVSMDVLLNM